MEPKYLDEEVIIHPNHHLTFGDWIPRVKIAWVVTYTTRTFRICRTDVGRPSLESSSHSSGQRYRFFWKLTWPLHDAMHANAYKRILFKVDHSNPIQISITDNCHLMSFESFGRFKMKMTMIIISSPFDDCLNWRVCFFKMKLIKIPYHPGLYQDLDSTSRPTSRSSPIFQQKL